jgi:ubiquinone/menaquinone biosynthesis C-methylase UbiE
MGFLRRAYEDTDELNREAILAAIEPRPGGIALDIGCGDGVFTRRVADRAAAGRALGVEMVDMLAQQARSNGVEVTSANIVEGLPYEDASIDVVHCNQVIEHLSGTDVLMKEIRRILRPDGYAVLSTNNLASWHNIASLVMGWQPPVCHVSEEMIVGTPMNFYEGGASHAETPQHLRIFTGDALAQLATYHGLTVDLARVVGYYPLPAKLARVANRVDRRHGAYLVQRYRPAS